MYKVFFCSFDFLLPFFISLKCDLNFCWLFFTSAKSFLPSRILLTILRALSNSSKFTLAVLPLYLYIKSLLLTLSSKSIIFWSLSSTSLLSLSFCLETNGVSSSPYAYFLIILFCPLSWIAFTFLRDLQSFSFVSQKLSLKENK